MGFTTILGLDLGKFKSVCCVMNVSTHTQTFETIQTTPQALHDLLTLHTDAEAAGVWLVIETCDAAGWVHDLARSLGVTCTVIHTAGDERNPWAQLLVEQVSRGEKTADHPLGDAEDQPAVPRTGRPRPPEDPRRRRPGVTT